MSYAAPQGKFAKRIGQERDKHNVIRSHNVSSCGCDTCKKIREEKEDA